MQAEQREARKSRPVRGRTARKVAIVAALVISGGLITGTASAMEAAPTKASRLGPYKHWYTCESTGNRGTESGPWEDYDCRGHNGAVYLYPRY
jgi:hypothetical protein